MVQKKKNRCINDNLACVKQPQSLDISCHPSLVFPLRLGWWWRCREHRCILHMCQALLRELTRLSSSCPHFAEIKSLLQGLLWVLWLRLHTPSAGGPGWISGQGTRCRMPHTHAQKELAPWCQGAKCGRAQDVSGSGVSHAHTTPGQMSTPGPREMWYCSQCRTLEY